MELEEALKKITELEGKVETLTKENTDYKAGAEEVAKQLKEKDATIEDMQAKARERGEQFKKLRDMTAEEKELLTEKERELLLRTEQHEEEFNKFKTEQDNFKKSQRDALVDALALKKAGGNREVADKIKVTLSKIKDIENKSLEAELLPEIDFAFNGLAIKTSPDALGTANNTGGDNAPFQTDTGFAETSEHKGMSAEQTTGTASSYARKYALNGLFLIDETEQDADSKDNAKESIKADVAEVSKLLESSKTLEELQANYKSLSTEDQKKFAALTSSIKLKLSQTK